MNPIFFKQESALVSLKLKPRLLLPPIWKNEITGPISQNP
jgi:hypothetical protein